MNQHPNCSRESLKIIIFTPSSELTSETWWILFTGEILSCLEIKVVFKMCKNCSLETSLDFKVDLKSRLKFMSWLEIKVVFKMRQNPPFISTCALIDWSLPIVIDSYQFSSIVQVLVWDNTAWGRSLGIPRRKWCLLKQTVFEGNINQKSHFLAERKCNSPRKEF